MFKNFFQNKSLYSKISRNFSTKYDFDLAVIGGGPAGKFNYNIKDMLLQ
jgi:hypothetical protein